MILLFILFSLCLLPIIFFVGYEICKLGKVLEKDENQVVFEDCSSLFRDDEK